uniref:Fanciful K+ uptake-b family transporter n=1 Tax=Solanum tuberosum TaxID=4113 RepID=M1BMF6_SOLTU
MGERSRVPPSGGIIPRNMFKYGSHRVLKRNTTFLTMYAFQISHKIEPLFLTKYAFHTQLSQILK